MTLTPTDQLLLSSVKIQPTSGDLERMNQLIPQITNWDELAQMAIDRGMAPLLYKKLGLLSSASMIPDPAKQKLQGAYYRTLSRSMVLYDAFRKAAEAITAAGIQVVALKGIYLSEWLYKDIGLRQFSDIDLLVKKEDGEKCLEILKGLGYKSSGTKTSNTIQNISGFVHYDPLILNGVSIELHINLHGKGKSYHLSVEEMMRNSETVMVNKIKINTLCLNDLLIFLCIHLDKHFINGNVQFTGFIDIANLLQIYHNKINWTEFVNKCNVYQCEDVVFKYLILVNKFFNAVLPDKILEKNNSLLTEKDIILFFRYLHGYIGIHYEASSHLKHIHQLVGFKNKSKYILNVVFPTKQFMIQKYQIETPKLYLFYYPYRLWIGLKGFSKWLFGRK